MLTSKNNILKLLTYSSIAFFAIDCANISSPQGGKKDTKKPILLKTIPENNIINYNKKKVTFLFNEKINGTKLKEVTISPSLKNNYEIDVSGKKVNILFKDTLQKNKTYKIEIKEVLDVTEGNITKNLSLRFSPNSSIDTFKIKGKLIDGYSKKIEPKYFVGLYKNYIYDSIFTKSPDYQTVTNDSGEFSFDNLKKECYKIVAYNPLPTKDVPFVKKNKLAFTEKCIQAKNNKPDSIILESSYNDLETPKVLNIKQDKTINITLSKAIYKYEFISKEITFPHELNTTRKEINIYNTILCEDSVEVKLKLTDSTGNDTTANIKLSFPQPKKYNTYKDLLKTFDIKERGEKKDSLEIKLVLNDALYEEKLTPINLIYDSVMFTPLSLLKDFNKETNYKEFNYRIPIRAKKYVQVILNRKSVTNIPGDTNSFKKIQFDIKDKSKAKDKKDEEEQKVEINIKSKNKNIITEILNEKNEIIETIKYKDKIILVNMKPAYYSIRLIEDRNMDAKWNRADIKKNKGQEKVKLFKNVLLIKKNWDIEALNLEI